MSQAAIARELGLSSALMTKLKKQGCPMHSAEAVRDWRRRNVTGYCRPAAPPPPPPQPAPLPVADDAERLDLAQERALLIRAQRQEVENRLRLAAGQYAEIGLLSRVLADASAAVVGYLEHLPARIRRACPLLPARALDEVVATVAAARNEWVRATVELVAAKIETIDDGEDEPAGEVAAP
jgi:phage terminase Nu1 subunit (DNA packaging protein)